MAKTGHYSSRNELEIDSQVCSIRYCIRDGKLSMYSEDSIGDLTFACAKLRDLLKIAREIEEIYNVYVDGVGYMKWSKPKEDT